MRRVLDALAVSDKLGLSTLEVWVHVALGQAHILAERWSDAIEALERSLEMARTNHIADWQRVVLDQLAAAHLGAGDAERARVLAEEAIAMAERQGAFGLGYRGHLTLALALVRSPGRSAHAAIVAALAKAQAQVERTGARSEEPHIHLARAELAGVLGDDEARRRELREAHRLFIETGATGWAERVARQTPA
jgi:tetratricopeptide (TPR) repeat protein